MVSSEITAENSTAVPLHFLRFRKPFCSEAWNAISTYVFTMVQGGEPSWAVNHTILTCCNDGARPVVFKLERIDD